MEILESVSRVGDKGLKINGKGYLKAFSGEVFEGVIRLYDGGGQMLFAGDVGKVEVDGSCPETDDEAIEALSFIGDFKSGGGGGGVSPDDVVAMQEKLDYLIELGEKEVEFVESTDWVEAMYPDNCRAATDNNSTCVFKDWVFVSTQDTRTSAYSNCMALNKATPRAFTSVIFSSSKYANWTVHENPTTGDSKLYVTDESQDSPNVWCFNEETETFNAVPGSNMGRNGSLRRMGGKLFTHGEKGLFVLDDDTSAFVSLSADNMRTFTRWFDYSEWGFLLVTGSYSPNKNVYIIDLETLGVTIVTDVGMNFAEVLLGEGQRIYKGGAFLWSDQNGTIRVDVATREIILMNSSIRLNNFILLETETGSALLGSGTGLYKYDEDARAFVQIHPVGTAWGVDYTDMKDNALTPYIGRRSMYLNGRLYLSSTTSNTGIISVDIDGNVEQVTSDYYSYYFLIVPGMNFLLASCSNSSYGGLWRVDADGTFTKIYASSYIWVFGFEHAGGYYVSSISTSYYLGKINADGTVTMITNIGRACDAYLLHHFENGAAVISATDNFMYASPDGTFKKLATYRYMHRVLGLSADGDKVYVSGADNPNAAAGIVSVDKDGNFSVCYPLVRGWDKWMEAPDGKKYVTKIASGHDGILELDEDTGLFSRVFNLSGDYSFYDMPINRWLSSVYEKQLPSLNTGFKIMSWQSGYVDGDDKEKPAYTVNQHGFISIDPKKRYKIFVPAGSMLAALTMLTDADSRANYYRTYGSVVYRVLAN
jgi:hypothetical protein